MYATSGRFETGLFGAYSWCAVARPGSGWSLDTEASAAKDFRVSYWRRPRVRIRGKRTFDETSPNDRV